MILSRPVQIQALSGSSFFFTYHHTAGTIYVVTGGGGKSLYEIGSDYWTAYAESIDQYVKVDILQEDKALYLQSRFRQRRPDRRMLDI